MRHLLKSNPILLILLILGTASCSSEDDFVKDPANTIESEVRETHSLCFVTWNLALGLGENGDLSDVESAQVICQKIIDSNADVLTLQEVWDFIPAIVLAQCLDEGGYAMVYNGSGTLNGDGLLTVVKKSMLEPGQTVEDISTFREFRCEAGGLFGSNGSNYDSFADKGFFHTSITLEEGCVFDVINLHLDAGDESEDKCARICQLQQLNDYINLNVCGNVLVGGDFNINEDTPFGVPDDCGDGYGDLTEYEVLMEVFNGTPTHWVTQTDLGPTSLGGAGLIDYHIISNYDPDVVTITSVDHLFDCEESFRLYIQAYYDETMWHETEQHEFSTEAEAIAFAIQRRNELLGQGFINVYYQIKNINNCNETVEDFSDHIPVRTCLDYNCDVAEEPTCQCIPVLDYVDYIPVEDGYDRIPLVLSPYDCDAPCPKGYRKITRCQ